MKNLPLDYGIGKLLSNNTLIRTLCLFALATSAPFLSAVDFVAEGEKQLGLNNPAKALTYLEAALAQGEPTEQLWMNLGLTYTRLSMKAEAQQAFQSGADLRGPAQVSLMYNLGVAKALAKDFAGSEAAYTQVLALDPTLGEALLNRANVRLELKQYDLSASDYRQYQAAVPENPQKSKIEQLITLLENASLESKALELAEQTRKQREVEAQKVKDAQAAAETAAAAAQKQKEDDLARAAKEAENQKIADEQARLDAILAGIRETLAASSAATKTLSTGPAGVKTDEGDFALEP